MLSARLARWYRFKPKIQICVNFGGSCNGRCWYRYCISIWYILRPFGIFYGHLAYFWLFSIIFPVLVCCSKNNLATLMSTKNSTVVRLQHLASVRHNAFNQFPNPFCEHKQSIWLLRAGANPTITSYNATFKKISPIKNALTYYNADVVDSKVPRLAPVCLVASRGVAWRRVASRGVAWRRVASRGVVRQEFSLYL
jgi:hypothetical protein